MSSNLIKLPIDPAVLVAEIEAAHNHKMKRYQEIYDRCDAETEEGQALMVEMSDLAEAEQDSYKDHIELIRQNKDLQTKNDLLARTVELIRQDKEEEVRRMEELRVRAERMKNSQRSASRNARNDRAWEAARGNGRRS